MPVKECVEAIGAALLRKAGEGRKTGKGSVRPGSDASSGKHRDPAAIGLA